VRSAVREQITKPGREVCAVELDTAQAEEKGAMLERWRRLLSQKREVLTEVIAQQDVGDRGPPPCRARRRPSSFERQWWRACRLGR